MVDESNPKTLYVGNLDSAVTEDFLTVLFQKFGIVTGCKLVREHNSDPYAFIEYSEHSTAVAAFIAMNKRLLHDREMKVNWASSPANQPKVDTSKHHHIFVGDLSPEIDSNSIKDAFAPFGEISNCKVVRDSVTLKPKGYAFISFLNREDAESAIKAMNGQWLGSRTIKTNWSTRTPGTPRLNSDDGFSNKRQKQHSYAELYNESSPTNRTVYCGGFGDSLKQCDLEMAFSYYGDVEDVKIFTAKGYAFIRFKTKEDATRAIEALNNSDIRGYRVKCYWGKEVSKRDECQEKKNQTSGVSDCACPENYYPQYTQQTTGWYAHQNYGAYLQAPFYYQHSLTYAQPNTMLNCAMPSVQGALPQGWIAGPSGGYPTMPVPETASPYYSGYIGYQFPETSDSQRQ